MKSKSALRILEAVFQAVGLGLLIGAAFSASSVRAFVKEADRSEIWFLPVFLGGFGAVFGGIGLAFAIVRRRKADSPAGIGFIDEGTGLGE